MACRRGRHFLDAWMSMAWWRYRKLARLSKPVRGYMRCQQVTKKLVTSVEWNSNSYHIMNYDYTIYSQCVTFTWTDFIGHGGTCWLHNKPYCWSLTNLHGICGFILDRTWCSYTYYWLIAYRLNQHRIVTQSNNYIICTYF